MTSTSSLSQTNITLQFALERDIDAAAQDVQAAINSASGLPKDLPSPPTYEKVNPSAFSILSLAATSDTMPLPEVYDYVDNVVSRALSQFPGVGVVDYHGDQVPAIRVQVNPSALAAHGSGSGRCSHGFGECDGGPPERNFGWRKENYHPWLERSTA